MCFLDIKTKKLVDDITKSLTDYQLREPVGDVEDLCLELKELGMRTLYVVWESVTELSAGGEGGAVEAAAVGCLKMNHNLTNAWRPRKMNFALKAHHNCHACDVTV